MFKKLLLPAILFVLAYGFWISPNFKEISAGVAIFLFGMLSLEEGFKAFTGGALEKVLKASTNRKWKSVGFGVLTTTIMQSSSLVSVITISFLSAGLLGLAAGIGIIFGANIGTTTGAWLVAALGLKVKISAYAMPLLVFGVIFILQSSKKLKGAGYILAGIGFLFLGIDYMKGGFEAFRGDIDLASYAIEGILGLFVYTLIGIVATVIMQSSHATLVLIITALAAGQITYENALALAIGANVGTTITAVLGAMSANVAGKRLAGAHLIFNLLTGLVAIVFLPQFLWAVDAVSANVGIAADDYTLKLAIFHTLFNLAGVIILFPFIERMVVLLEKRLPEPSVTQGAMYLDDINLDFPETSLIAIRNETIHLFETSANLLFDGIGLSKKDVHSQQHLPALVANNRNLVSLDFDKEYEQKIKGLYSEIIAYISQATFTWEMEQSGRIHWLRIANQKIIEAVKGMKHLRKNLAKFINHHEAIIPQQYDQLRIQIAYVMRELHEIGLAIEQESDEEMIAERLKLVRGTSVENERVFNMEISKLLHRGEISPFIATSMINDNNYALTISNDLIDAVEMIYSLYRAEEESE